MYVKCLACGRHWISGSYDYYCSHRFVPFHKLHQLPGSEHPAACQMSAGVLSALASPKSLESISWEGPCPHCCLHTLLQLSQQGRFPLRYFHSGIHPISSFLPGQERGVGAFSWSFAEPRGMECEVCQELGEARPYSRASPLVSMPERIRSGIGAWLGVPNH